MKNLKLFPLTKMSDVEYEGEDVNEDFEEVSGESDGDESEADEYVVRKKDEEKDDEDDEEKDEDEKDDSEKKKRDDDSDSEKDESNEEELIPINNDLQQLTGKRSLANFRELKGAERRTIPVLRKFEKVLLITTRVKQLNRGAKSKIAISRMRSRDSIYIAQQEMDERVIPNKILRIQPQSKTYEILGIEYFTYIDRD
jgi:DNA-directed RNA polymerase subunit K/omega